MYGTVMVGRLKAAPADVERAVREWYEQRRVPGFLRSEALVADDGSTVVSAVWFESREHYLRLADDPDQDRWWRERMAPLLDGEPQWIDGTWQTPLVAMPGPRAGADAGASAGG